LRPGSRDASGDSGLVGADLLVVQGVTVRFGGLVANDDITIRVPAGGIVALLGPNGAGKSTLFDVITGARRPNAGRVFFAGRDVTQQSAYARARAGIGRTFQNLALVRDMTVFDNVYLGAARFRRYGPLTAALRPPGVVRRSDAQLASATHQVLQAVGLTPVAEVNAGDLPYGDQRRVELARAMALRPQLLMLDEPAAGMDRQESVALARALGRIREIRGTTILVVEHDLDFVRTAAEYAYVLDFGKILATGTVEEVLADEGVRNAYLGKEVEDAGVA
jgi:branched-chain amino acid transport system ATP-binding protein